MTIPKFGDIIEQDDTLKHFLCKCKWYDHFEIKSLALSYKNKHIPLSTLWLSNSISTYLPTRIENMCPQKTSTKIFLRALFLVHPNWKPLKCPSVGEGVNYSVFIQD